MKNFYLVLFLINLLAACSGSFDEGNTDTAIDGPEPSREWQLVWSDEFNGDALDTSKWNYQIGDGRGYGQVYDLGWGNNEEQYYTDLPDNVKVEDGNLIITARADGFLVSEEDSQYGDPGKRYDFTSARINTSEKFEFTYGRVEAKIKIQSSSGLWHAFWLLGSESSPYGGWPQKGEIDILEAWEHSKEIIGSAAHFGTSGVHQYKDKKFNVDFNDGEYHIYAIEWDSEQIRWFVDGEHFYTLTRDSYWNYYEDEVNGWQGFVDKNADEEDDNLSANQYAQYNNSSINAPFDKDQYIILNTAVNGNLPASAGESADPNALNVFLGEMQVDYVKVYQCPVDPLLPVGTGCKKYLDTYKDDPNYSNPSFIPEFRAEQSSFSAMTDLYIDGVNPEPINGVDYTLTTDNGVLGFITDPEDGNTYLEFTTDGNGIAELALSRLDEDKIILAGFGGSPEAKGDIKFDIWVEDFDGIELEDEVEVGLPARIFVGLADPSKSKFLFYDLKDLPAGQWHRMTVSLNELFDSKVKPTNLQKLFSLKFNKATTVRIDNIQLACGGLACGIIDEVPVFIDEVSPLWTRGILGNDAQQKSTLFENPDYSENDKHHVQWKIIDTGELGYDFVIETTIGKHRSTSLPPNVDYPAQAVNFIGSEVAISSIAALAEGEFRFDLRMTHNPNDVDLYFKVDGANSSTGEQTLGELPIGEWVPFACPISSLIKQGLDVSTITAPFVMVPGVNGKGKDLVFEWDNVIFSPVIKNQDNVKVLEFPITFDQGGFCLPIAPFDGGAFQLSSNPSPTAVHTDAFVGKTSKQNWGVTYGGIKLNLAPKGDNGQIVFGNINSTEDKRFTMKVLSPRNPADDYNNPATADDEPSAPIGPMTVTFQLEPVPGKGSLQKRTYTLTKQNEWEEAEFDFNGVGASEYEAITLIIDNGFLPDNATDNWTLYFDEIYQSDSTTMVADLGDLGDVNPVVFDFDQLESFVYPNPSGYQGADATIVPDPDGQSGNVGRVRYNVNEGGLNTRGVALVGSGEGFPRAIPFADGRTIISIRVNTPVPGTMVSLKVEDDLDNNRFNLVDQTTTQAGWQTLNFDFSDNKSGYTFEKLGIIFDREGCIYNVPGDKACNTLPREQVYYFDDIQLLPQSP